MADPERDPKPGEVWRERRRQYAGRTVRVKAVDVVDNGYVTITSLTDSQGRPRSRFPKTRVRLALWHKTFEFDRKEKRDG